MTPSTDLAQRVIGRGPSVAEIAEVSGCEQHSWSGPAGSGWAAHARLPAVGRQPTRRVRASA
jgi:hypothetical protein